jgi:hypothetical protein
MWLVCGEQKYGEGFKGKEPLGWPRSRQRKITKWIGWRGGGG